MAPSLCHALVWILRNGFRAECSPKGGNFSSCDLNISAQRRSWEWNSAAYQSDRPKARLRRTRGTLCQHPLPSFGMMPCNLEIFQPAARVGVNNTCPALYMAPRKPASSCI